MRAEEIKLFLAKSSWVDFVHHYYFEDTDAPANLTNSDIKDSIESFTEHINRGLSLNKKDWIDYLINEGWSKDEEDVNNTWLNIKEVSNES